MRGLFTFLVCLATYGCSTSSKIKLDAVKQTPVGQSVEVEGYISFRAESQALYPTPYFEDDPNDCLNLTNIRDFFDRDDTFRKVQIRAEKVPNPHEGEVVFLTCTEYSFKIVSVLRRDAKFFQSSNDIGQKVE